MRPARCLPTVMVPHVAVRLRVLGTAEVGVAEGKRARSAHRDLDGVLRGGLETPGTLCDMLLSSKTKKQTAVLQFPFIILAKISLQIGLFIYLYKTLT